MMATGHDEPTAPGPRGVMLALSDDADILRTIDAPGSGMQVVRRCADTAELLSVALAGLGTLAVIGTDFDELDRSVLDRLNRAGVTGLLLAPDADRERWESTGWPVESTAASATVVCARLQSIARSRVSSPGPRSAAPAISTTVTPATPASPPADAAAADLWDEFDAATPPASPPSFSPRRDIMGPAGTPEIAHTEGAAVGAAGDAERGRLVVVWGPHGAPGRSTVAAALASGLAGDTILVDADIEAPSLTQLLGLPEDSSALATAARLAARGRLDAETLDRILVPISEGRRLLTGLGRPGRWRELPPAAMPEVWERCRHAVSWTVVDVAGGQVDDAVDDFTLEPGRGAVSADLLRSADVVVIVGAGDPIGVRRLLQLMDDLDGDMRPTGRVEVVVNRVRASAAGPSPQRAVREALARFGGLEEVIVLPEDAQTADRCLMEGRSVLEAAPGSPLGRALAELVDRVDPNSGTSARADRAARGARLQCLVSRLRTHRRPKAANDPTATARPSAAPAGAASSPAVGAATPAPPPPPQAGLGATPESNAVHSAIAAVNAQASMPQPAADNSARRRSGRHRA
ncbi:AAA family ATPase [Actinomyces ruminis]|uniref:CobQ/CobB/MinD/ParA nucleotide binding domain-containing protein n=1 Tax=Actinomyces ruminis TaxID=1937003 RepID=A0ABX4MAC0_9ACTO|nr:hypothetical protein [Actinomyces ruminis]PHP52379.1 hypothetical protein BW737_009780 [Actinomyces ruminis]